MTSHTVEPLKGTTVPFSGAQRPAAGALRGGGGGWAGPRAHRQLTRLTELPLELLGNAQGVHRCVGPNVGPLPTGMMGIWDCLGDVASDRCTGAG